MPDIKVDPISLGMVKPKEVTLSVEKPENVLVPGHAVTPIPTGVEQKWNTIDGLPPRYVAGNLTPVNAK